MNPKSIESLNKLDRWWEDKEYKIIEDIIFVTKELVQQIDTLSVADPNWITPRICGSLSTIKGSLLRRETKLASHSSLPVRNVEIK